MKTAMARNKQPVPPLLKRFEKQAFKLVISENTLLTPTILSSVL